jgi:hypothetical protein
MSVIMLNDLMLSVVVKCAIMLSVVMLCAIMLSEVAPNFQLLCVSKR